MSQALTSNIKLVWLNLHTCLELLKISISMSDSEPDLEAASTAAVGGPTIDPFVDGDWICGEPE